MSLDPRTFCSEMREIKSHLAALLAVSGGETAKDDLYLQLPESTTEIHLAAGETYEKTIPGINRRLKYLCVSVPAACVLQLINNNTTIMWFCDEAGTLEFAGGKQIGDLTVRVVNSHTDVARWVFRAIFV